jgi:hypothetical protein
MTLIHYLEKSKAPRGYPLAPFFAVPGTAILLCRLASAVADVTIGRCGFPLVLPAAHNTLLARHHRRSQSSRW